MSVPRFLLCLSLLSATAFVVSASEESSPPAARPTANARATGMIWPQFLGPDRDNRSHDKGLLKRWPEKGPRLQKTIRGLGIGFSNISIADGVAYTMGNHGKRELVLAFNLESGENEWKFDNAPAYQNGFGDGPRSTPTIDGDRLYALGGTGELVCLDRQSGTKIWQKNIVKEFGSGVPGWGICESVLIDGDRLICTPGGRDATLVALDKKTGGIAWKAAVPQNDPAAYASPILVEAGGVKQIAQLTAQGTIGIRASDGKFMWRDDSAANGTANCCAPVADESLVVSASGYGKGGSMVELSSSGGATSCRFAWHSNDLTVHHGGLVLSEGHIYAANDQALNCVELKTGKLKWKNRSVGKGSVTFADGRLVVRSEGGPVALVEATPAKYRELGRFNQPERSGSPAWTYPVVAGGKLYLRDQDKLFMYDVKGN